MGNLTFSEMRELYLAIHEDETKDYDWHALFARNRFGIQASAKDILEFDDACTLSGVFDDL